MKKFILTLVLSFLSMSIFCQSYKQLDVLTKGTQKEIVSLLSEDSDNCFEVKKGIITSYNTKKKEKLEIIVSPRVVSIETFEYDRNFFSILTIEGCFQAQDRSLFIVNYFNNSQPLKIQLVEK